MADSRIIDVTEEDLCPGLFKKFQGVIVVHLNTHLPKDAKYSLVDLFDFVICQRSV